MTRVFRFDRVHRDGPQDGEWTTLPCGCRSSFGFTVGRLYIVLPMCDTHDSNSLPPELLDKSLDLDSDAVAVVTDDETGAEHRIDMNMDP